MTTTDIQPTRSTLAIDRRLRRVIDVHFDPTWGSRFWLERARELRIDPRQVVQRAEDLDQLGETTADDLRRFSLMDYVPRRFHSERQHWKVAQTGGTTGVGIWTAYSDIEFHEAFVDPFVAAASSLSFPCGEEWLFIGPSGPHVIGKAVRALATAMGSPDPFMVDFDPRWAKKLPAGSFAAQRYLGHVLEQAISVIETQSIGVLFTTPPVLMALSGRMSPRQREQIRAIHYGGVELTSTMLLRFQRDCFPQALHLSGYGNTLFGCCLELSDTAGRELEYFPHGDRLLFQMVDETRQPLPPGASGRVQFSRIDETMLIVRMLERDVASLAPLPAQPPAGFEMPGVRAPHTPASLSPRGGTPLY